MRAVYCLFPEEAGKPASGSRSVFPFVFISSQPLWVREYSEYRCCHPSQPARHHKNISNKPNWAQASAWFSWHFIFPSVPLPPAIPHVLMEVARPTWSLLFQIPIYHQLSQCVLGLGGYCSICTWHTSVSSTYLLLILVKEISAILLNCWLNH